MKLLLLNTCGAEASVALADTVLAEPVLAQVKMLGRTASERLVTVMRAAMGEAGWTLSDLAAIAVVTGPGSFTGVRVGLSVAKGLSEASGVPLLAISRLALLAASNRRFGDRTCALLDAGRGEFYCGVYERSTLLRESLMTLQDALEAAQRADTVVVCEQTVAVALEKHLALQIVDEPAAADTLALALKRLATSEFDDPVTLDANYLRRNDAEIFAKPVARRPD